MTFVESLQVSLEVGSEVYDADSRELFRGAELDESKIAELEKSVSARRADEAARDQRANSLARLLGELCLELPREGHIENAREARQAQANSLRQEMWHSYDSSQLPENVCQMDYHVDGLAWVLGESRTNRKRGEVLLGMNYTVPTASSDSTPEDHFSLSRLIVNWKDWEKNRVNAQRISKLCFNVEDMHEIYDPETGLYSILRHKDTPIFEPRSKENSIIWCPWYLKPIKFLENSSGYYSKPEDPNVRVYETYRMTDTPTTKEGRDFLLNAVDNMNVAQHIAKLAEIFDADEKMLGVLENAKTETMGITAN